MAYNPGITNRSGEILAQGIASAAQTRMQGYQNVANSLLKGFTDLSKKQQEEELKRNEALAKFQSDPDLLAKLSEKGNEDLKARYDRLNAPVEGFWAKFAGRNDLKDSDLLSKFALSTQEATTRATAKTMLDLAKADAATRTAEEARREAEYVRNLAVTEELRKRYGYPPTVNNSSSPPKNAPYFRTSSNPKVPLTGVSNLLANQSTALRDSPISSGLINNNPFIQGLRTDSTDTPAKNIPEILPTFEPNNRSQTGSPVTPEPMDNSILAKLSKSGVTMTNQVISAAIMEQARLDAENRSIKPEGSTGPFVAGNGQERTYVVRNGKTVDLLTGLPLESTEIDSFGYRRTVPRTFPQAGVGMGTGTGDPVKFPNFGSAGGYGKPVTRATSKGYPYQYSTTPEN